MALAPRRISPPNTLRQAVARTTWTALACAVVGLAVPGLVDADDAQERSVLVSSRKSPGGSQPATDEPAAESASDAQPPLAPVAVATDQQPKLATKPSTNPPLAEAGASNEKDTTGTDAVLDAVIPADPPASALDASPSPVPSEDSEAAAADVETARFHGVQPGTTTLDQLLEAWGKPSQGEPQAGPDQPLVYRMEPFKQVQVEMQNHRVQSVVLELAEPSGPADLAKKLRLDRFRPAPVRDRDGAELGSVYPERGVVFSFAPRTARPAVSHVLLEPVSAHPFLLRAEAKLHGPYRQNLEDLRQATRLEPESSRAWWQTAAIELATGRITSAEQSAGRAVQLDPAEASYRLRWAACLSQLAKYEQAVNETRRIAESSDAPAHIRAQALVQLARLRSVLPSAEPDAVTLYQQAIEIAGGLSTQDDAVARRAAKSVLVDAHLGMAREIAQGEWREKEKVVPQWLERASAFAEDMVKTEGAGLEIKLRVAIEALETLSAFPPSAGPAEWVREAQVAADALFAAEQDELWQSRIHWETAHAYLHALRVEHSRGKPDAALKYGQIALGHFRDGARLREPSPLGEHLVGRLYFHMGAVHAIHHQDHDEAIVWYEKAAPLLMRETPKVPGADARLHGDALVSMGVSYWEADGRDRALELTQRGSDVLKQAVHVGALDESALAVAYGNLANMHKLLGNSDEAERFIGIAERVDQTSRQ